MLVLARKKSESIIVENINLEIVFLGIGDRGECRLGFTAPTHVVIDRKEIYERKKAEKIRIERENLNLVIETLKEESSK